MINNQKGFAPAILLVLVVVLGVIGYVVYARSARMTPSDIVPVDQYQTVSDSDDLTIITKEFEETDLSIDEFESELDTLETEVSTL